MKNVKIKTSMNAHEFEKHYEINNEPSLTVPDQTMSIQEILERYARGLPIGGQNEGYYDEEDDLPDPRTLDLEERAQLAMRFEDEIKTLRRGKHQDIIDENTPVQDVEVETIQDEKS